MSGKFGRHSFVRQWIGDVDLLSEIGLDKVRESVSPRICYLRERYRGVVCESVILGAITYI
jgi:hypothetical protein